MRAVIWQLFTRLHQTRVANAWQRKANLQRTTSDAASEGACRTALSMTPTSAVASASAATHAPRVMRKAVDNRRSWVNSCNGFATVIAIGREQK